MHIHVVVFLNTYMYTYNVYTVVYIVPCLVHNSHHNYNSNYRMSTNQPHAPLNTPTATAPLLPWDEVSTIYMDFKGVGRSIMQSSTTILSSRRAVLESHC